jgi:hypothetical protein
MSRWGDRAKLGAVAVVVMLAVGSASPDLALAQAPTPGAPPINPEAEYDQLRERLAITPAQEAKFAALVQVMRQNDATRDAFVQRNPPAEQRNAPSAIRLQAEAAGMFARSLQRLLPPFQALYASLSPEQRQAADELFARPQQPGQAPPPGQMPPPGSAPPPGR